jgi:hypothetical protein
MSDQLELVTLPEQTRSFDGSVQHSWFMGIGAPGAWIWLVDSLGNRISAPPPIGALALTHCGILAPVNTHGYVLHHPQLCQGCRSAWSKRFG